MNERRVRELYIQSLDVNRETFAEGKYDMAYHALMLALYCADELKDTECFTELESVA